MESQDIAMMNVEVVYSNEQKRAHSANPTTTKRFKLDNNQKVFVPGIFTVPQTQCKCLICPKPQRTRVKNTARENLWSSDEIFLSSGTRSCSEHLENGVFSTEAKKKIHKQSKSGGYFKPADISKMLKSLSKSSRSNLIDVETGKMSDADYKLLFGVNKINFEDIFSTIKGHLNNTAKRSARNALAIFLAKLRLGVSQKILAYLFGIKSQRKVSAIISRVTSLLMTHFVPMHLGFNGKDRNTFLAENKVELVTKLFDVPDNSAALFLDGTYLFIQKSKDHRFQKRSWSLHKNRNLLKAMMVVMPNGRILFADGLYFADYKNSDSDILRHMLAQPEGLASFVKPGDHLIVDRGFQFISKELRVNHNLKVHMPALIPKNKKKDAKFQFEAKQANATRKITSVRCIVEMVNGRIKNVFKFFDQVISARYYIKDCQKKLGSFFKIACAILNAYSPPLLSDDPKHIKILEGVRNRSQLNNTLKSDIGKKNLYRRQAHWIPANQFSAPNFPRLTENELFDITLGCYQINNAAGYVKEHFYDKGQYEILMHQEKEDILRARIQSR